MKGDLRKSDKDKIDKLIKEGKCIFLCGNLDGRELSIFKVGDKGDLVQIGDINYEVNEVININLYIVPDFNIIKSLVFNEKTELKILFIKIKLNYDEEGKKLSSNICENIIDLSSDAKTNDIYKTIFKGVAEDLVLKYWENIEISRVEKLDKKLTRIKKEDIGKLITLW